MTNKKYNIIYADPPWSYRDKMKVKGKNGLIRGAASHYPVMNIREIKNISVSKIAAENCVLFLWITMPLLKEGLEVIESWGFKSEI